MKAAMARKGGYILHLDGTFEGRGPLLMSGLDFNTETVLGNVKLPSEKAEEIVPFLENLKEQFGTPAALVHDMGPGILGAVQTVFPGVPDFICHYHFPRDLGNDFLGSEYDTIRKRLRKHGISTRLRKRAQRLRKTMDAHPGLLASLRIGLEQGTLAPTALEHLPALNVYSLVH